MFLRLYKQFVSAQKLIRIADDSGKAEVFYFTSGDVSGDDIVFETENEFTDTPATRRTMLFDLLNAGILTDKEGKLSQSSKAKILTIMGFGNWDNAQDVSQLHIARAETENLDINRAEVLQIDDHLLHAEEHTRYVLSCADKLDISVRDKIIAHIQQHRQYIKEND